MNLNDFKTLSIGGQALKKLVRASDGLVLFDKSGPEPQPWIEIEYDGNQSSIFMGELFAGYYGGSVLIDWGDGSSETVSVPSGGQSAQIRRNDVYGVRIIRFKAPASFFTPALNSRTMLGIRKIVDKGENLVFRNTLDSGGVARPGLWNCSNLSSLDLRFRTSVPALTQNGYFDANTGLTEIVIPHALEAAFREDSKWNQYAAKFVVV